MVGARAVKKSKKKKITSAPERPSIPFAMAIRMFLIGSIAVIGAVWAIWRHYSVPRTPMLVPVPSATEIPVEVEPPP